MAAPMLAAVAGVNVRETRLRRDEVWWLRQYALDPPAGQSLVVGSLWALRRQLDQHLRLQLSFFVKVKFDMEVLVVTDGDPFGNEQPEPREEQDHYMLEPSPWISLPDPDPERRMRAIVETCRAKLEEHLESARLRGSREMIGGIKHVYLLISPGEQLARLPPAPIFGDDREVGAHPHPLPKVLEKKRCFWNPQTHDFSCFSWRIRAHLAEVRKWPDSRLNNSTRLLDNEFYEEGMGPRRGRNSKMQKRIPKDFGYDFSTLPNSAERGVKLEDITSFEQANRGRILVTGWAWHSTEWEGENYFERKVVREPSYFAVLAAEHHVHLLRLDSHYVLIHNMNAFQSSNGARMGASRSNTHASVHICPRCRCGFKSEQNLQKHFAEHRELPCSRDCSKRQAILRMPSSEFGQHLVKYAPSPTAEMAPLVIYADLEAFCDLPPSDAVGERTHRVQRRAASVAFRAVGRDGFVVPEQEMTFLTRTELHDGEHASMERFFRSCLRLGKRYHLWKTMTNVPPRPTQEEMERHESATSCASCSKPFDEAVPARRKVLHHRHGTGEYLEPLCFRCNCRIKLPKEVPVLFHNGGSYDFKFLLRTIAYLRQEAVAQPSDENAESSESEDEGNAEDGAESSEDEGNDEDADNIAQMASETSIEDAINEPVDFKKLSFKVLFKSGEKLLQIKLGNLVFRDSMNFYNSSLGDLMDNLAKTCKTDDVWSVFPLAAATHPELKPEALTVGRRVRLRKYFAPDKSDCTEEDYMRWTWQLLLRKLPMPFDHMTDPMIWDKKPVWDMSCYSSKLKKAKTVEEQEAEHKLLRETAEVMGWTTFREFHDCYLHMDLCLADIMEAFRAAFFDKFGLDPLQYITLPSASHDAMKKSCLNPEPARLIVDKEIYETVRESVMGGLSCAFQTYTKANSPELGTAFRWTSRRCTLSS